jgi:succinoglycan biosynthesis protein ExoA
VPEFVATVVIPVRNEERYVSAALDAVLAQDVPDGALEVLVVDGQSTDRTREIVGTRGRGARFPVRIIDNPGRIAATALNIGAEAAESGIVVRVDGHAEIPTDYVRRLVETLDRTAADVAGGAVLPVGDGVYAESVACAMRSPLGHGGAIFRAGGDRKVVADAVVANAVDADTVAFPAYRKDALLGAGGFDAEMVRNQDDDLHLRLRRAGKRIALVPGLITTYHCRQTRLALFRQYFGYGLWKVIGWRKRGRLSSKRALAPALLVAGLAVWTGLMFFGLFALPDWDDDGSDWMVTFVFAGNLALAMSVAGYLVYAVPLSLVSLFVTPRPPGWRWLRAPPSRILVDMHFAYGLGFWWGVLRRGRPPRDRK